MQNEIIITWDPSLTPVSGYNVYRGTAPDNESTTPLNSTLITQLPPFSLTSVSAAVNGRLRTSELFRTARQMTHTLVCES